MEVEVKEFHKVVIEKSQQMSGEGVQQEQIRAGAHVARSRAPVERMWAGGQEGRREVRGAGATPSRAL